MGLFLVSRLLVILMNVFCFFFFKQKTAYEMRISDWSSDVCSSDLDFGSQEEAAAFGVGLKLFGGAILANKGNPLFSSFLPQLYQFIKDFKAGAGNSQEKN